MIDLLLAAALTTSIKHAAAIPQDQIQFAQCVSTRESHGNYKARHHEAGSTASGRWQFLDKQWRHGLSFMVTERLAHFGADRKTVKEIRQHLLSTSINHWEPQYQNIAFVAALNAKGKWSGAHHWYIRGSRCNELIPIKQR